MDTTHPFFLGKMQHIRHPANPTTCLIVSPKDAVVPPVARKAIGVMTGTYNATTACGSNDIRHQSRVLKRRFLRKGVYFYFSFVQWISVISEPCEKFGEVVSLYKDCIGPVQHLTSSISFYTKNYQFFSCQNNRLSVNWSHHKD